MTLRHLIFNNFWWKVLSVVLATVIWISVTKDIAPAVAPSLDPVLRDSMPVTVNVMTQPGDARVFRINPKQVLVTVTGESAVMKKFRANDFHAYVDLTEARRGMDSSYEVRVHPPDSSIAVLRIEPRAVNVDEVSP